MKAKYIWSSMNGTYRVDCDIIEETDEKYKIRFFDDIVDDYDTRWVYKDCVDVGELKLSCEDIKPTSFVFKTAGEAR